MPRSAVFSSLLGTRAIGLAAWLLLASAGAMCDSICDQLHAQFAANNNAVAGAHNTIIELDWPQTDELERDNSYLAADTCRNSSMAAQRLIDFISRCPNDGRIKWMSEKYLWQYSASFLALAKLCDLSTTPLRFLQATGYCEWKLRSVGLQWMSGVSVYEFNITTAAEAKDHTCITIQRILARLSDLAYISQMTVACGTRAVVTIKETYQLLHTSICQLMI
ncbi:uncharacterized protein LOC129592555 [Paramacrobiotus metropolitanus]|uniref:uncharacterized protein LOC129592555 n=1 Tax=Paramacrobiotus metropolitanus TaxID=2943436 RepID=UPI0024459498|nr:uncharacterized protein LOC129592555 [Paramacrobiotus metropolitanus]XP_055344596.1 uncharacterized protein LOC129592555 [Paramacrobiotus metropolitanus]